MAKEEEEEEDHKDDTLEVITEWVEISAIERRIKAHGTET